MAQRKEKIASISKEKSEPLYVPPDGGWGWVVAVATFVNTLLFPMILQMFSILFAKLLKENNTSTMTTAWIFNLAQLMWHMTTIFLPALCAEYGWRKITIVAGILVSSSTIISSWVKKPEYLFLALSLPYGIGAGLGVTMFHFIISQYFDKKRGRVIGIMTCAFSLSQFVAPMLIRKLQDSFGAQGTILIIGGIMLNVLVGAMLYHPIEWHWKVLEQPLQTQNKDSKIGASIQTLQSQNPNPGLKEEARERRASRIIQFTRNSLSYGSVVSLSTCSVDFGPEREFHRSRTISFSSYKESKEYFGGCFHNIFSIIKLALADISSLTKMRVIILTLSTSLNARLFFNMIMFVPFAVVSKGHSMELAAYCLTVQGICNSIIQPIISSLTDMGKSSAKWYFMAGTLICSASTLALSYLSEEVELLFCVGAYGIGVGTSGCVLTQLIIEVMGLQKLPSTIGVYGFVSMILSPTVGPAIGFIRDMTQSYDLSLKIVSFLHCIPFLFFILMPLAVKFDLRREAHAIAFLE